MQTDIQFWSYLAQFCLEWEMFQTKVVQKIKTHILCSVTFFQKTFRLWDNVGGIILQNRACHRRQIWRMRVACRIPKATNTHSQYVILITFAPQQWLHELASISRYACSGWLLNLSSLEHNLPFSFYNRARFLIYILKSQLFAQKYTLKTFTH